MRDALTFMATSFACFTGKEHSWGNSNSGKMLVKAFISKSVPGKTLKNNSWAAFKVNTFPLREMKNGMLYIQVRCVVSFNALLPVAYIHSDANTDKNIWALLTNQI
jgi:hypothetical protein